MTHDKHTRLIRRFARRTDGMAAIETAFVLPIFFGLTFATMEASWLFLRTSIIEQSVAASGRRVLTGLAPASQEVQGTPDEEAERDGIQDLGRDEFFAELCARVRSFGDCDERLSVEVKAFNTLQELVADQTQMTCPNDTGYKFNKMPYDPGSRNSYTLVRACFVVDAFTPGIGLDLRQNQDGTKSIIATHVRRNEPYKTSGGTGGSRGGNG